MGFYSIEYSWRNGKQPRQDSFNPDYFLKLGENIVVVEIEPDGDDSEENKVNSEASLRICLRNNFAFAIHGYGERKRIAEENMKDQKSHPSTSHNSSYAVLAECRPLQNCPTLRFGQLRIAENVICLSRAIKVGI